MRSLALALISVLCLSVSIASAFSDDEKAQIVAFWNQPGRYTVTAPPESLTTGPWRVRLTPEASRWFLAYSQAVGGGKAPPTVDSTGVDGTAGAWEKWVPSKLAYDRRAAQDAVDAANAAILHKPAPTPNPRVPAPGPAPADLIATVGNPPPLARAEAPLYYTVAFDDSETYSYEDHVSMRPRFAYYRFADGVVYYGAGLKAMSPSEAQALFEAAGMTPSEQRIAAAVSRLEGDFESVNTYDTGFVSIGFIQFASMGNGRGSLSEVLDRERTVSPGNYEADFRKYGIDVDPDGGLVVVDPSTGAELQGSDAVLKIIQDKRLTAVFQRAGRRSISFRVAQIQVAKSHYWPASDSVTIELNGHTITGTVSDVIHSEAGMATLFDRKVNRGSISPFAEVVSRVMAAHGATTLPEAARFEREIVEGLHYRANYLTDKNLSQPR